MAVAQVPSKQRGTEQYVAEMENISKNFGNVRALVDFDFKVRAGELTALLGPNGAGKTTAIKLLLGLLRPQSGRVSVFATDPTRTATHTRLGAMLQVGRVRSEER